MPVMAPDRGLDVAPQVGVSQSRRRRLLKRPRSQPRYPPATAPIINHSANMNSPLILSIYLSGSQGNLFASFTVFGEYPHPP